MQRRVARPPPAAPPPFGRRVVVRMLPMRQLVFLLLTFMQTAVINSTFAIVAPFFPLYAQQVNIPPAGVAAVFGAFAIAQIVMSPVAGGLASRFGRKRVLTVGVLGVGGSTLAMGLCASIFTTADGIVAAMVAMRVVS